MTNNYFRVAASTVAAAAFVLLAACGGSASPYCRRVEDMIKVQTGFDFAIFNALNDQKAVEPGEVKKFIDAFVRSFGDLSAVAPPEISEDVATLWKAAKRTQDELRKVGYDIERAEDSEDEAVSDARTRFDEFNAEECSLAPGGWQPGSSTEN